MKYAIEIMDKEWYGVKIPSWLRVFDCRGTDTPTSPEGYTMFGSEKACYDLGLRNESYYYDSTPWHCSTYTDSRTASEDELKNQVTDMVTAAKSSMKEYRDALKKPAEEGQGGSCYYLVVGVAISNYGWAVIADTRQKAVRGFD